MARPVPGDREADIWADWVDHRCRPKRDIAWRAAYVWHWPFAVRQLSGASVKWRTFAPRPLKEGSPHDLSKIARERPFRNSAAFWMHFETTALKGKSPDSAVFGDFFRKRTLRIPLIKLTFPLGVRFWTNRAPTPIWARKFFGLATRTDVVCLDDGAP